MIILFFIIIPFCFCQEICLNLIGGECPAESPMNVTSIDEFKNNVDRHSTNLTLYIVSNRDNPVQISFLDVPILKISFIGYNSHPILVLFWFQHFEDVTFVNLRIALPEENPFWVLNSIFLTNSFITSHISQKISIKTKEFNSDFNSLRGIMKIFTPSFLVHDQNSAAPFQIELYNDNPINVGIYNIVINTRLINDDEKITLEFPQIESYIKIYNYTLVDEGKNSFKIFTIGDIEIFNNPINFIKYIPQIYLKCFESKIFFNKKVQKSCPLIIIDQFDNSILYLNSLYGPNTIMSFRNSSIILSQNNCYLDSIQIMESSNLMVLSSNLENHFNFYISFLTLFSLSSLLSKDNNVFINTNFLTSNINSLINDSYIDTRQPFCIKNRIKLFKSSIKIENIHFEKNFEGIFVDFDLFVFRELKPFYFENIKKSCEYIHIIPTITESNLAFFDLLILNHRDQKFPIILGLFTLDDFDISFDPISCINGFTKDTSILSLIIDNINLDFQLSIIFTDLPLSYDPTFCLDSNPLDSKSPCYLIPRKLNFDSINMWNLFISSRSKRVNLIFGTHCTIPLEINDIPYIDTLTIGGQYKVFNYVIKITDSFLSIPNLIFRYSNINFYHSNSTIQFNNSKIDFIYNSKFVNDSLLYNYSLVSNIMGESQFFISNPIIEGKGSLMLYDSKLLNIIFCEDGWVFYNSLKKNYTIKYFKDRSFSIFVPDRSHLFKQPLTIEKYENSSIIHSISINGVYYFIIKGNWENIKEPALYTTFLNYLEFETYSNIIPIQEYYSNLNYFPVIISNISSIIFPFDLNSFSKDHFYYFNENFKIKKFYFNNLNIFKKNKKLIL